MDINGAITALTALGHDTRLAAFRLLVRAGPEGMAAGEIAEALSARGNTLSANLNVLLNAGLVTNRREGRSIRYFAGMETMRALLDYLLRDCCGGNPALCRPLIEAITCGAQSQNSTGDISRD